MTPIVEIRDVVREFPSPAGTVHAVRGVTLDLAANETLALVGESGCGKSTLGRLVVGLDRPTAGTITVAGADQATSHADRRRAQMVFQHPKQSLNPRYTVERTLDEPLRFLARMPSRERSVRIGRLLDQVGLDASFRSKRPGELSGGQQQRVAIARALASDPDVVVLDEPTSALDQSVRALVLDLLGQIQGTRTVSYLLITHDLESASRLAHRVAVMYLGRIVELGPVDAVLRSPAHPYTRALLAATPSRDPHRRGRVVPLDGETPDPRRVVDGCAFADRCVLAEPACRQGTIVLEPADTDRVVACPVVLRATTETAAARPSTHQRSFAMTASHPSSTSPIRFGLGVPTGTEGMMYPVPYADPAQAVELAVVAEQLGFDSVWGNDHVSTQRYVREEFSDPPRFYDPLTYMSYVAASTTRLGLGTAIMVVPFRHPVMAAKQLATLDQLSGGRVLCGVGIGAYREEFEAMSPGRELHRGRFAVEYIDALHALFRDRRTNFAGEYLTISDVESFPKPHQERLPILSGGNSPGVRRRAALQCDGWLPACLSPDEIAAGLAEIHAIADAADRQLVEFDVAPQLSVCLGSSREDALARFDRSQLASHMRSLAKTTLKDQQDGEVVSRNLIGTAEQVGEQVQRYIDAGVTTLSALLFACDTVSETLDAIREFAELVIAPVKAASSVGATS